jgi:hypothetical protein
MRIERFEDLDAWKEARKLTVAVYQATQNGVLSRDFGLSSQMQRAAKCGRRLRPGRHD